MANNHNEVMEWAATVDVARRLPLALLQLTQVLYSSSSPHPIEESQPALLIKASALIVTERRRMEDKLGIDQPDGTGSITEASLLHAIDFLIGSMMWKEDNIFKVTRLRAAEANLRSLLT